MKKVVIGIAMLLSGVLTTAGIILAAVISLPDMNAWSNAYPSRLWFLVFAGNSGDGLNGLGLGLPMLLGIAMTLFGLVALLVEYFRKN